MKQKTILIKIKKLKKGTKKYEAEFKKGNKIIKRKFGSMGMSDYTLHNDSKRRNRYIKRHKKDLKTNDPTRAGYLSMYILWNKKTFKASLNDYKRRLNKYNKSGKFRKEIKGSVLNKFGVIKSGVGVLKEYKPVNMTDDVLELINEQLKAMVIQKYLLDKMPKINEKKRMLRVTLRALEEEEYEYNINDEITSDLIKDAYLTLNKSDLTQQFWQDFIRNIINGIREAQYRGQYSEMDKAYYLLSRYYISLLFNKLKLSPSGDSPSESPSGDSPSESLSESNEFGKSKIPDNVINKKLYSKIKDQINMSVKKKNRRWGAYDSGRLVKQYKKLGGKYKTKDRESKLDRWYKEKWIDACKWPKKSPCGRSKAKQKLTYCRPSIKINSQTPKTVQELTKLQIKNRCNKKKKNNLRIVRD